MIQDHTYQQFDPFHNHIIHEYGIEFCQSVAQYGLLHDQTLNLLSEEDRENLVSLYNEQKLRRVKRNLKLIVDKK